MTLFVLFSQYLGLLKPPNTTKQGKTQNDKSTLFTPPQGGGSHFPVVFLPFSFFVITYVLGTFPVRPTQLVGISTLKHPSSLQTSSPNLCFPRLRPDTPTSLYFQ